MRMGIGQVAALVTVALGATGAISIGQARQPAATVHGHHGKGTKTLYSQNDNNAGYGFDSQNYTSGGTGYNDQGADDFVVPKGKAWSITEVDVTGQYYGSGPAKSENVSFYRDSSGLPGKLVKSFPGLDGQNANTGSFAIVLPAAVKLKAGHYWVSVQANCGYPVCGQWDWEVRSVQSGNGAAWENPNGEWGRCPSWTDMESCWGYGPDFMFDLIGTAKK